MVAEGGNTGAAVNTANTNNNAVLLAALGPCTGFNNMRPILINELTTVISAYALSNFMSVTGTAPHYVGGVLTGLPTLTTPSFAVNIGAPATNAATTGCVANLNNPTCTSTVSAGLAHAFNNVTMLIDTSDAYLPPTTANGANVPQQEVFTLGNVLQACVNSTGGGTNLGSAGTDGTGLTNTSTVAASGGNSGLQNDGTVCGRLFSYTSYTNTGTLPGTTPTSFGNTITTTYNVPTNTLSGHTEPCQAPHRKLRAFQLHVEFRRRRRLLRRHRHHQRRRLHLQSVHAYRLLWAGVVGCTA